MPKRLVLLLALSVILLSTFTGVQQANAVTGADWVSGNIIDDTVFTDTSRLSISQIQDFLNTKVPNCDTYGSQPSEFGGGTRAQYGASQGNPAPFTCLRDYHEVPKTSPGPGIPASNYGGGAIPPGSKSAAHLIWDASQKYNISPAVLLVKLGTESAGPLTSDTWPFKKQYNYAMGAHCPDSGPGGSANCDQNYAGFSLQIDEAAALMRWYLDSMDQPWWSYKKPYQNNHILWNVAPSGCGGADVYIQNKATAALYTYTPYQPNQAALNNLYGTGDGCSAYGNRNFWRVYSDWFGSATGSIIRTHEDGKMYVRGANNTYYYVVSGDQLTALGYGDRIKSFYNTSKNALQSMTFAGDLPSVVRFNNGESLYGIDGGKKHYFDHATWTAYGQPAPGNLSAEFDQLLPLGSAMSSVIQNRGSFDLYAVELGKKRHIGGPDIYQSGGYNKKPVMELTNYLFNSLPKGAPILAPGTIVIATDTGVSSVINQNGTKRTISADAAKSIGIYPYRETSSTLDLITTDTASAIPLTVKNSQGDLFITDGTYKIHLNGIQLTNINRTAASFTLVENAYLANFVTKMTEGSLLIQINDSERVYKVEAAEMIHIQTGEDFNKLGYNFANVISLKLNTAAILLTNPYRSLLLEGTLFKTANSPTVYLFGGDQKAHAIPTGFIFDAYKFQWGSVREISPNTLLAYPGGSSLAHLIRTPDDAWWLVNNGLRHWIPENIRTNYTAVSSPAVIPVPISTLRTINPSRNTTEFIRVDGTPTVYYIKSGEKHALSPRMLAELGGSPDRVTLVSNHAADSFKIGSPMY